MKKISVSLIIFLLCLAAYAPNVYADASLPAELRVGLYYDSNARASMKISSAVGLTLGYYQNNAVPGTVGCDFTPLLGVPGTNGVIVRKDTYFTKDSGGLSEYDPAAGAPAGAVWGPYHLQYFHDLSVDGAKAQTVSLKAQKIDAFIAVTGLTVNVWGGCYTTDAAARAAASASPVSATVTQPSDYRIIAVDPADFSPVMLFGDPVLGLGILPNYTDTDTQTLTITTKAVTTYHGGLDFRRLGGGNLTVVNVVPTEQYVCGVISEEMSPGWPLEALKAQAVCARNFAATNLGKYAKEGFDLSNGSDCQEYIGTGLEGPGTAAAVAQTKGQLLSYGGEPAEAVYCSSMGSETEDAQNVWGTAFPYLVSVDNSHEDTAHIPNGVWTAQMTAREASDMMKEKGYDVGDVTNIEAVKYSPAGSVLELKVTGTTGEKTFTRENTRFIFGEKTLSQKYTVAKGGGGTGAGAKVFILSQSGKTSKPASGLYVLSGAGKSVIDLSSVFALGGSLKSYFSPTSGVSSSDAYTFCGEGWGHGVGMSQYGAKGMAEAGFTYDKILEHYFTGTTLAKDI